MKGNNIYDTFRYFPNAFMVLLGVKDIQKTIRDLLMELYYKGNFRLKDREKIFLGKL